MSGSCFHLSEDDLVIEFVAGARMEEIKMKRMLLIFGQRPADTFMDLF